MVKNVVLISQSWLPETYLSPLAAKHPELRTVRILQLDTYLLMDVQAEGFLNLEHLEEFELSFEHRSDKQSLLCNAEEIKSTRITSFKIRNAAVPDLYKILNKQTHLRSLHLEAVSLRDADVEVIGGVVSGLVKLNLCCNKGKICCCIQ